MPQKTAIALLSGGLDSQLAVRMMLQQGIRVIGLHLYTGFCIAEHKRRLGVRRRDGSVRRNPVFELAESMGISLELRDISETYLQIIRNPRHGTGSGVNPCRDCRIHMFEQAFAAMEELQADFIVTGEVLGQRPMSQVRHNLEFIHRKIKDPDLVLMPLSAKLMPPTLPEREGWVDRSRLGAVNGRGRREQMRMAREMEITEFETPAGGCCFLTDEAYARKFRDLFKFDPEHGLSMEDVILLGVGRHYRLDDKSKIIIGRDEGENAVLERHAGGALRIAPTLDVAGPLAVLQGDANATALTIACALVARYADYADKGREVSVRVISNEQESQVLVVPAGLEQYDALRI